MNAITIGDETTGKVKGNVPGHEMEVSG